MIILLNPDTGAPIKDFTFKGATQFTKNNQFEPGTLFQFEDEGEAEAYKEHFGFLQVMTPDEAKIFMGMEKMKCDKCDFETRVKTHLDKHLKMHEQDHELSSLGIPVVKRQQTTAQLTDTVTDLQKQIDAQDRADGLEGAGIIDDRPIKNVIMS